MIKLLFDRSFGSLTLTQFLGAFNDNVLKQLVMLMAVGAVLQGDGGAGYQIQAAATAAFALPFLCLSSFAGELADRFSKNTIIVSVKFFEILIMLLAGLGIYYEQFGLILGSLFLLSAQSAFFSPAKYGVIPELLSHEQMSRGNGIIQTTTYVAILTGTASAGLLLTNFGDQRWIIGTILIASSATGFIASLGIEGQPPADPQRSVLQVPFRSLSNALDYILHDRFLFLSIIGFSYVWFAGSVLMINLNVYGMDVMGLNETWTSLMIVVLAGGLGAGCLLAGRWSGDGIEPGLVPVGALGMGGCLLVFLQTPGGYLVTGGWLFLSGVFGGLFLIPLQTSIQERPEDDKKGCVLGTTNICSFTAVLLSAAFYVVAIDHVGLGSRAIMGVLGGMTIGAGILIVFVVPRFFVRFVLWLLVHTIYRIETRGKNHVPDDGPALLVANHVSYVDGLLLGAGLDRFIRFLTFAPLFELPLIGSFLRLMKMIPVDPSSPKQVQRALDEARKRLRAGELVCIFVEGQITRTGQLLGIRRGVVKIGQSEDVPVVPVHLDEIWGSIFSYEKGKFFWKMPKQIPYPVTITYGEPIDGKLTKTSVREAIQVLGARAAEDRVADEDPLPVKFARTARRNFWRMASVDSLGTGPLRFGTLLVMTYAMASYLDRLIPEEEKRVGVMLPPSVPGAVVNMALACIGKISVNLNYTSTDTVMEHYVEKADLERVITSDQFLEKIDVNVPVTTEFVEEIRGDVGWFRKVKAGFLALLPAAWSTGILGDIRSNDDVVTIIFSSGSTGDPKGVELTHGSVLANIQSLQQVAKLNSNDRMMAILPFFHSFGYTGGLWLPYTLGFGTCYHFDPMDARTVGKLMDKHEVSMIIGTPTFFRLYAKRCDPDQFSELRLPVCGAEKLKKSLANTFYETFDRWPLEGYGCTEMSPAVSVNIPDVSFDGQTVQKGMKLGSVGRPLPGVAVRIVDPQTKEPLEDGEEGLVMAAGGNRMKGYLDEPELTEEVFHGLWYETGDIGKVDEDGFLHITGRLARFSKIGGEMVPHVKVEESLEKIIDAKEEDELELAVTDVSDDRKGEQLVVLYSGRSVDHDRLTDQLEDLDLPKLWIPDRSNFYQVDEIPKLGTGTLDIQGLRKKADELINSE